MVSDVTGEQPADDVENACGQLDALPDHAHTHTHPYRQADYAKNTAFYQSLQAFQNGTVYRLYPFNMYTTNIDTVIADAYAVGKALYPKQFSDIDIAKKADAIYQFLVGKPVYHQMQNHYGALGGHIRFK